MCWSWQVATVFSAVELLAIVHLWWRNWCPQDRWAVPFLSTILIVELVEIPMWVQRWDRRAGSQRVGG